MRPLGSKQLDLLAMMTHVGNVLVVPNALSLSLCRRGLMEACGKKLPSGRGPGFIVVTAAGLRAVADAIDEGRIPYKPDLDKLSR